MNRKDLSHLWWRVSETRKSCNEIVELVQLHTNECQRSMISARKLMDEARECLANHDISRIDPQHRRNRHSR
jgi:hypothetical protein